MRTLASRRRALVLLAAVVGIGLASSTQAGALPSPSTANATGCGDTGCVRVLEMSGLIDPVIVDFVDRAVADADSVEGTVGVVLELNSPGVVVDDDEFNRFVERLRSSPVPVSVWVGPSGAEALGGAAELAAAVGDSSIAPGSKIGDVGAVRLDDGLTNVDFEGRASGLRTGTVSAASAVKLGVISRQAPTAGDHLIGMDGVVTKTVKDSKGQPRRQPVTPVVIAKLPLTSQFFHTIASPAVAYLLFAVGVGLLIFEFFTAGIGIAGVVGAGAFLASGYGLGVLPLRTWAIVLLAAAGPAFAIDVQAGVPRLWTLIGMSAWVVGSWSLFVGVTLPWPALVTGIAGMALAMVSGMPSMVRARFGTPTIGRESMIGRTGSAASKIDPDGLVLVDGGRWRAHTRPATPLAKGASVTVVAIDGLSLEVEATGDDGS